jgi:tetratricopeptide (TPR) repeat protein
MAKYKCPTLGDCDRANAGEVFERSPGDDLKCPGCSTLLEPQAPVSGPKPGARTLPLALAAAVLAVAAGGSYLYVKRQQPVPEATQASVEAAAPGAAAAVRAQGGIAPSDAETVALRRQSETQLLDGKAEQAESAGSQAAANEMLKVAIAKMAQGKLDDAEKELEAARAHAPKQSLVYYNLAVLRLKQARTDDALKEFEAAFMAGFSHFKEMDDDKDLDALRKDPRFADLVKKYRPAGV